MAIANRQLAHQWAAQTKPSGKGSNFYYDGPTIYSYGGHFPIATFYPQPNGGRCVLFTTDGYSPSTSRHISYTRSALHGLGVNVFNVAHVPTPHHVHHPDNVCDYMRRIERDTLLTARSRQNKQWRLTELVALQREAELYRATFAPDMPAIAVTVSDDELRAAMTVRKAAEAAARTRAAVADAQARAEWRTGDHYAAPGDTMLRLSGNRETIETSRGARVPVSVAPALWALVQRARAGDVFEIPASASNVGDFTLRDITAEGDLIVGCHHIRYAELDALAGVLGLKATAQA